MNHFFVFFFKQKTAYEFRISDWSSDVCSSDLTAVSVSPISRPGTIPAMNSLVTEILAATPKMMKEIEGGMMGAMIPPAAIRPVDWPMRSEERRVGQG